MQIEKNKEIYGKYEEKILECDRFKMETVQLGEMYEHIYQENIEIKNKLQ
jgi:hypothetical protein